MTVELVFATRNRGKVAELTRLLSDASGVRVVGVDELDPAMPEIVEDGLTFEDNARKKAIAVAVRCGRWSLADDSGLEVDALDGAPGVRSARYSDAGDDAANVAKLLGALDGVDDARRTARFRCVLALAAPTGDVVDTASGVVEGAIARAPRGASGFGYDPVFVPGDEARTMAELGPDEKDARSHRGAALRSLLPRLVARLRLG